MIVKVLQKNLKDALAKAGRAVGTKSTLPVLSNVLMIAGDGLQLVGNNLEVRCAVKCGALVEESGSTTIPWKALYDYVSALPNDTITLSLDALTQRLTVSCRGSSYVFLCIDADEFPSSPPDDDTVEVGSLTPENLFYLAQQVLYAAADEHTNPILQGVHIIKNDSGWLFEAIDGYRLAIASKPSDKQSRFSRNAENALKLTIPANALALFDKVFDDQDDLILISRTERGVTLRTANSDTVLYSRTIDGSFPDLVRFLPPADSAVSEPTLHTAELLNALKRAKQVADKGGNIVEVYADGGVVTIRSVVPELATANEKLDTVEGCAKASVGLNIRYVMEMIAAQHGETATLVIGTPNTPVYIKSEHEFHLVMPMRLPERLEA